MDIFDNMLFVIGNHINNTAIKFDPSNHIYQHILINKRLAY